MSKPMRKLNQSTTSQIIQLVDYMCTHHMFAVGEFTGPLGSRKHEAQWVQLKTMLDECGPTKSVDQWKHTWRDLKKKARNEAASVRLAQIATGNTASIPVLSDRTEKILGVIGREMACGISVECETLAASSSSVPDPSSQHAEVAIEMEGDGQVLEPPHEMPPPQASPLPASAPHTRGTRGTRVRSRRVAVQPSPSQAFIAAQKENNNILKDLTNKIENIQERSGQQQIFLLRMKRRTAGYNAGPKLRF